MNSGETTNLASATEIDACAAEWLQRRHFLDWGEKDQVDLDAWLAKSFAHRAAYLRLADVWRRTERLVALRPSLPQRESRLRPLLIRSIATVAALAFLAVGAVTRRAEPVQQSYITSIGGRETIMLVDGSQVELNTDSALRVSDSKEERTVWLDRGEAYFDIRHDAARPFVVIAGGHKVTDLGTKFIVRRDAKQLEVSLVEGLARFDGPQNQRTILTPGDVVVANAKSLSVTRKSATVLASDLGWRRGVLVFNHTTLAEAVGEFNRYNRTKLVVADPVAANRMIYGTFPTSGVDAFIRLSQAVFGLRIEKRGDETVISR